jgi:hypothetical protein
MSEQIRLRLEEIMALIPCPDSGCWPIHGAETDYFYDENCECHVLEVWPRSVDELVHNEGNGHEQVEVDILYELAEFDFTELVKSVKLENFHFSQCRAVFEIGWKEFGQDLELRLHIKPEALDEE